MSERGRAASRAMARGKLLSMDYDFPIAEVGDRRISGRVTGVSVGEDDVLSAVPKGYRLMSPEEIAFALGREKREKYSGGIGQNIAERGGVWTSQVGIARDDTSRAMQDGSFKHISQWRYRRMLSKGYAAIEDSRSSEDGLGMPVRQFSGDKRVVLIPDGVSRAPAGLRGSDLWSTYGGLYEEEHPGSNTTYGISLYTKPSQAGGYVFTEHLAVISIQDGEALKALMQQSRPKRLHGLLRD